MPPGKTDGSLGGTKQFVCHVKGYPRPTVNWFKDGTDVSHNNRYQFVHTKDGIVSLIMENITFTDEGCYRCRAENSEGVASTSAYLFVKAVEENKNEDATNIYNMTNNMTNTKAIEEIQSNNRKLSGDIIEANEYANKKLTKIIDSGFEESTLSNESENEVKIESDINSKEFYSDDGLEMEANAEVDEKKSSSRINADIETDSNANERNEILGLKYDSNTEGGTPNQTDIKAVTQESKASNKSGVITAESDVSSSGDKNTALTIDTSVSQSELHAAVLSVGEEQSTTIYDESAEGTKGVQVKQEPKITGTSLHKQSFSKAALLQEQEESSCTSDVKDASENIIDKVEAEKIRKATTARKESKVDICKDEDGAFDETKDIDASEEPGVASSGEYSKHEKVKRDHQESNIDAVTDGGGVDDQTEAIDDMLNTAKSATVTQNSEFEKAEEDGQESNVDAVSGDVGLTGEAVELNDSSNAPESATLIKNSEYDKAEKAEEESNVDPSIICDVSMSCTDIVADTPMKMETDSSTESKDYGKALLIQEESNIESVCDANENMTLENIPDSESKELQVEASIEQSNHGQKDIQQVESQTDLLSAVDDVLTSNEINTDDETHSCSDSTTAEFSKAAGDQKESRTDPLIAKTETDNLADMQNEFDSKSQSNKGEEPVVNVEQVGTDHVQSKTDLLHLRDDEATSNDLTSDSDLNIKVETDVTSHKSLRASPDQEESHVEEIQLGNEEATVSDLKHVTAENTVADFVENFITDLSKDASNLNSQTIVDNSVSDNYGDKDYIQPVTDTDISDTDKQGGLQFDTDISDSKDDREDSQFTADADISDSKDDREDSQFTADADISDSKDDREDSQFTADADISDSKDDREDSQFTADANISDSKDDREGSQFTADADISDSKDDREDSQFTADADISDSKDDREDSQFTADVDITESKDDTSDQFTANADITDNKDDTGDNQLTVDTDISSDKDRGGLQVDVDIINAKGNTGDNVPAVDSSVGSDEKQPDDVQLSIDADIRNGEKPRNGPLARVDISISENAAADKNKVPSISADTTVDNSLVLTPSVDVSVTEELQPPQFVIRPVDITVTEGETVKFECSVTGEPGPQVTWHKDGKLLESNNEVRVYCEDDKVFLEITKSEVSNSGMYTCQANNRAGSAKNSVKLTVLKPGKEGSPELYINGKSVSPGKDSPRPRSPVINIELCTETDENYLREYKLSTEYSDNTNHLTLEDGEVIQLLDSFLKSHWLIRKEAEKDEIGYVPITLITTKDGQKVVNKSPRTSPKRHEGEVNSSKRKVKSSRSPSKRMGSSEREGEITSEDEEQLPLKEAFPSYIVIADYIPTEDEADAIRLTEGQVVDALDYENPHRWLVKTKPTKNNPSKVGWAPSSYLDVKTAAGQPVRRTTREVFREDIIQITNKQQEALVKRSSSDDYLPYLDDGDDILYALTELIESEREYIHDLKYFLETYCTNLEDAPDVLNDKKDIIFGNIQEIYNFHNDDFLNDLNNSMVNPGTLGKTFLAREEEFMKYIPYFCERKNADVFINTDEVKQYLKEFSANLQDSDTAFSDFLKKPVERIEKYLNFLKDFLRYTSRAGEDCKDVEEAIEMLMEIERRTQHLELLALVEGYSGELTQMAPLIRHGGLLMWDSDPSKYKGKDRYAFLFPEKIILTKKQKMDKPTDTVALTYKDDLELQNLQIFADVPEDERRFELWYAEPNTEKLTFQARNKFSKQAWLKDLRSTLKKLGIEETDIMPERRAVQPPSPQVLGIPRKSLETGMTGPAVVQTFGDSGTESDIAKTDEYFSLDSYESDASLTTCTGSYHTAPEYEDGSSRPFFRRRLRKMFCKEGAGVRLECMVGGNPLPEVAWLKNNQPVTESEHCHILIEGDTNMLFFPTTTKTNTGTYSAQAINKNGTIVSTAELVILDEIADSPEHQQGDMALYKSLLANLETPTYIFKMTDCQVEEGRMARFDCRVVAYPLPDIIWFKDDTVVETNERFKLLNFNNEIFSLLLESVTPADSGRYTCLAKNEYGHASTEALLNVIALSEIEEEKGDFAPKFITKFYDMELMEGIQTEFGCTIAGRPDPSVTWFFNGQKLKSSDRISIQRINGQCFLDFKKVLLEDSGTYTCKLANDLGEETVSARLLVREDTSKRRTPESAPEFATPIEDMTVKETQRARFDCVVKGVPKPEITWYCNGKRLLESSRVCVEESGDRHTLILSDISFDDAGEIKCRALSAAGEAYCFAALDVRESRKRAASPQLKKDDLEAKYGYAPTFTKRPLDMDAAPGKHAKFECRVLGMPEPDVKWFKGAEEILPSDKHYMSTDGGLNILTVRNVEDADVGDYSCEIRNRSGYTTAHAKLGLGVERIPEPRISPARPGVDGIPFKRPLLEQPTRRIPLLPTDKPSISDVQPESARLSWLPAITTGLPVDASLCTYALDRKELPDGDWAPLATGIYGNSYYVKSLKPDKEYMFRVKAENIYGASEPTIPVSLSERPVDEVDYAAPSLPRAPPILPRRKPFITDVGEDTMRLAWKPAEMPPVYHKKRPPISYTLEMQELPETTDYKPIVSRIPTPSYLLSDLLPDHDYMVRVRAENEYGFSEPTEPLWIPRAKAFPGIPIERPEIIEIEPRSVGLHWNRVDIPCFEPEDEPLRYMLELQEPPSEEWREVASGLPVTSYTVTGLEPHRDYNFRVRAQTNRGVVTEPSPVASLYRTLARSYVPIDHLEISDYKPEYGAAKLSWQRVDIPPYDSDEESLMFMIEESAAPFDEWKPLASGIPTTGYQVYDLQPKQDYQFRVRAVSEYGLSPPSYPVALKTEAEPYIPRKTYKPAICDIEPEAVRLAWQRPPTIDYEPTGYDIEVREYPHMEWRQVARGVKDTSYRVSGLQPTRDYEFRVQAAAPTGHYEPLPPVSLLSTAPVKPRMPLREPALSEVSTDAIRLSWLPAEIPMHLRTPTPIHYTVEQFALPGQHWEPIARRVPDTSYTVRGLRPDFDYKFRVMAENEYGRSEPTFPVSFSRKPEPVFTYGEPHITEVKPDLVRLTWDPVRMPTGEKFAYPVTYQMEIQEVPGGPWRIIGQDITKNSYDLIGLHPAKDYLARIYATYNGYRSEPSRPVYISRRAGPPHLPKDEPYSFEVLPESLTLSWRAAELPARITDFSPVTYRVEVQEHPRKDWMLLATGIPNTGFRILGLYPDKEYSFRVRAENEYGVSEPTKPVVIRPRAVVPRMAVDPPLISDVGTGQVRLSWKSADIPPYMADISPVTYNIYIQEPPSAEWRPYICRIPHTSYLLSNLNPDRDYAFRVDAESIYGASNPTSPCRLTRYLAPEIPFDYPKIDDFDESTLSLSWTPRPLPGLGKIPQSFRIEMRGYDDDDWAPLASGIKDTSYRISQFPPKKDYFFRIRAEGPSGLSEPSTPISFFRHHYTPHVPIERPQIYELDEDSVKISWQPLNIPPYTEDGKRPVHYNIEARELPGSEWRTIATRIGDTSHKVSGLRPKSDYQFRVRAWYQDGLSEPSYHTTLFRKMVLPKIPLRSPEIEDVEPSAVRLKWALVDIPTFEYDDIPLTYMIEQQELPSYEWKPVAKGLKEPSYKVSGLSTDKDYRFRVRGEYQSSRYMMTEPTDDVPLYRRSVLPGLPIARPSIYEDDYGIPNLTWHPVHTSEFRHDRDDVSYSIEMQEGKERQWRTYASKVRSTSHQLSDLTPRKDYLFRIKAATDDGVMSEPTPPVALFRSKIPSVREPITLRPLKPVTLEFSGTSHPYIEFLTTRVPPRLPIEKPEIFIASRKSVEISWKKARVPQIIQHMPVTYSVEVRVPPSYNWQEISSGITGMTHKVDDLNVKKDYVFRVRAWNEYGSSEPTLPAFLHRPYEQVHEEVYEEPKKPSLDKIPPKIPMDTPRLVPLGEDGVSLSWLPARIPAYAIKTPIKYVLEVREPPGNWKRYKDGLSETSYNIRGLNTQQDYHFRIRAESQFGLSEATLPATLQRSKPPSRRESLIGERRGSLVMERRASLAGAGAGSPFGSPRMERKKSLSVERRPSITGTKFDDYDIQQPTYIETITTEAPPRVPSGRPRISDEHGDSLTLSWTPARVPTYMRHTKVHYTVESRQPPHHQWSVLADRVTDTSYHVTNLRSEQDYMFRLRAVNDFGSSEPTLPASLFREKEYVPEFGSRRTTPTSTPLRGLSRERESPSTARKTYLERSWSRASDEQSDIMMDYMTGEPGQPEFLSPDDAQFGVESRPVKIQLKMKGYPVPEISWFFGGDKLEYGDRYNSYITSAGMVTLEFSDMTKRDIGDYKCYAENNEGVAVRIVRLEMADPPTFIEPMKDVIILNRDCGRLECRVDGIPYPNIKFLKDWRPLVETSRLRIRHEPPDLWAMCLDGAIMKDSGMYACSAENHAGKVYCTARLTIADNLPAPSDLAFKEANVEDFYYILEEIGRGRHGIVRRVIERVSGREYAAKFIRVKDDLEKEFFKNELDNLRLLSHKNVMSILDAYDTPKRLVLVSELITGNSLLEKAIVDDKWSESEAAFYIKQLLETLQHIHSKGVLHLDIKPSNVLISHPGSEEIKLIDFGFARRLHPSKDIKTNYGTPEFASPEVVNFEPLTTACDIWGVGVLAYILITGKSPFFAGDNQETLRRIQICDWGFDDPACDNISADGKDFISKILALDPCDRLTSEECLDHPWIRKATARGQGLKISVDPLHEFYLRDESTKSTSALKNIASLRSLNRIMKGSESPDSLEAQIDPKTGEMVFPDSEAYGQFLDEETFADWQTRYQHGPDTGLIPSRDTNYTLRLREYRRTGGFDDTDSLYDDDRDSIMSLEDMPYKTLKERRALSDLDREEDLLSPYLEKEFEWKSASDELKKQRKRESQDSMTSVGPVEGAPVFILPLTDISYNPGEAVVLTCQVHSSQHPTISWYRNEELISDGSRVRTTFSEDLLATLTITSPKTYDGGVYKCIVRTKAGRAVTRCRLSIGGVPDQPGRPVVSLISSDEAFLVWEAPLNDGNSDILSFKVDCRRAGDKEWEAASRTISECARVSNLQPNTSYIFRVSCSNKYGVSPYSWASIEVRTKPPGSPPLEITREYELSLLRSKLAIQQPSPTVSPVGSRRPSVDTGMPTEPRIRESSPEDDYKLTDPIYKGKFSVVLTCMDRTQRKPYALKVIPHTSENKSAVLREFEILYALRHQNIVRVFDSFLRPEKYYILYERLYGENIARHLSYQSRYTEEIVSRVIRQLVDVLLYLKNLGIVHLNLQPGSIVMWSRRRLFWKLVDFRLAHKLTDYAGENVPREGYPDFMAPEVVTQDKVSFPADVWGIGVLTFLLLSGDSPFAGQTIQETLANVAYNRYDALDLYENVSKDALKFLFKILKRIPRNRPTLEDLVEHKWLQLTENMTKIRQEAVFSTFRLRRFADLYDQQRISENYSRDHSGVSLPCLKVVSPPVKEPSKRVIPKASTPQKVLKDTDQIVPMDISDIPKDKTDAEMMPIVKKSSSEEAKRDIEDEELDSLVPDIYSQPDSSCLDSLADMDDAVDYEQETQDDRSLDDDQMIIDEPDASLPAEVEAELHKVAEDVVTKAMGEAAELTGQKK